MRSRPSALTVLAVYALIATIGVSYFVIRDVAVQLALKSDEKGYDSSHTKRTRPAESSSLQSHVDRNNEKQVEQSFHAIQSGDQPNPPTFPIKTHIVTHGHPRTATTLLFNMVSVSYFLYLLRYDPEKVPSVKLVFYKRENATKLLERSKEPYVIKTHNDLSSFFANNTVVFTAAMDRNEARRNMQKLTTEGHTIAFIQDMESLKENGVPGLVEKYVEGFGLSETEGRDLIDYFSSWEVLRQCCGQQMSAKWRNDLMPEEFKRNNLMHHPTCPDYDIDTVEQAFMKTNLYATIQKYPNMHPMNKPSLNDDALNGTYCSSYNNLVRTQALSIWGVPGGRPVRSNLDSAIKHQFLLGIDHLGPEGVALLRNNTYRNVWKYTEEEKKVWVQTVEGARDEEYAEKATVEMQEKRRRDRRKRVKKLVSGAEEDDADDDSSADGEDERGSIEDDSDANETSGRSSDGRDAVQTLTESGYDTTHAIFLISFGKEASASTLVERCVLSLRRRGAFRGYVVVLTDANLDRYQSVWESKVIVMNPLPEHIVGEDGALIEYTKANASLKYKRFKTFILDYIDSDERLAQVETIYYLDIDILAGNDLGDLFHGVESKYGVLQPYEERNYDLSRMYFFTPLSKEWPLQGGTFILERKTSRYCMKLWQKEIDDVANTDRGRDQDALAKVYNKILSGEETKCELVRMENDNFLSLPIPRTFDSIDKSNYPSLIHISNSVFAKRIDETKQNELIYDVLQLTEEEKESGKYGKAVIRVGDRI